jgi:hypothetical protein
LQQCCSEGSPGDTERRPSVEENKNKTNKQDSKHTKKDGMEERFAAELLHILIDGSVHASAFAEFAGGAGVECGRRGRCRCR